MNAPPLPPQPGAAKKLPKPKPVCVYCGDAPGTTDDHIPPKALFPKPRPRLITVPACRACNQAGAKQDEEFATAMSMVIGYGTPLTAALWEQRARATLRYNKRLARETIGSARLVEMSTPGGLYLGQRYAVPIASDAYDKTLERITRGLYWHAFGERLLPETPVKAYWYRGIDDDLAALMKPLHLRIVGQNQFIYRFGRADDAPQVSMWFYVFYGRHVGGAITGRTPSMDAPDG